MSQLTTSRTYITIEQEIESIPLDMVWRSVNDFPIGIRACQGAEGDFFEA